MHIVYSMERICTTSTFRHRHDLGSHLPVPEGIKENICQVRLLKKTSSKASFLFPTNFCPCNFLGQ